MYENYSYEQVKNLPDDQKVIALKELKAIYPENKVLAQHWDVAHIAVSNLVGKYLEGKTVGRKKMTDEEKALAKQQREAEKLKYQQEAADAKVKEQENQVINNETTEAMATINTNTVEKMEDNNIQQNIQQDDIAKEEPIVNEPVINTKSITSDQSNFKDSSFSIKLKKKMTGEETILRLSGIANSLLQENEYKISLVIEEV